MFGTTLVMALTLVSPPRLFARLYAVPAYRDALVGWATELDLPEGVKLLEVGCGPGCLARDLAERGYRVTGVDGSPRMVRAARRSGNDAEFVKANAPVLPLGTGEFDAVISASLLNVVEKPVPVLRDLARVAKPGGTISCFLPSPDLTKAALAEFVVTEDFGWVDRQLLFTWARAARKHAPAKVAQWFAEAGLCDPRVSPYWHNMVFAVTANAPDARRAT